MHLCPSVIILLTVQNRKPHVSSNHYHDPGRRSSPIRPSDAEGHVRGANAQAMRLFMVVLPVKGLACFSCPRLMACESHRVDVAIR
jgi:hypothetical protein